MPNPCRIAVFPALGLSFLLAGCGPVDDRKEIVEERELPSGHVAPPLNKSFRDRMMPLFELNNPVQREDPEATNVASMFDWDLPEGWKEMPPMPMRLVNLRFGEGDVGECYLTILTGGGGGLEANVGRWYKQMGKEEPSAEAVAELPRAPLMNRQAVVIDLEGDFSSMGSPVKSDYRLVGRILPEQQAGDTTFSMFLKMTGPKEVVAANLEKFEQFCSSLKPKAPEE